MHAYKYSIYTGPWSQSLAEMTEVAASLTGSKKEACFDGDEYIIFVLVLTFPLQQLSVFSSSRFLLVPLIWLWFECHTIWMNLSPQTLKERHFFHKIHMFMYFTVNICVSLPLSPNDKQFSHITNREMLYSTKKNCFFLCSSLQKCDKNNW